MRKNLAFMGDHKISTLFRNLDKVNSVTRKIAERKGVKIKSHHRDFSQAFWMLIIFFKLIGFATFTHYIITQKQKKTPTLHVFKCSKLGIVYNVVLIILQPAFYFLSVPILIKHYYGKTSNMMITCIYASAVFGSLATCVTLLSYCVNQKSLVRIANRLTDVERKLDLLCRLHPSLLRQRIFPVLIVTCTLQSCFMLVLLVTEVIAFHENPIAWLASIAPMFHVGWHMIQYTFLVTIIQAYFVDVNRALQDFSDITASADLESQTFYEIRRVVVSNTSIPQLQQLQNIYCQLCDISEDVSEFYSVPILFSFSLMFLMLVVNMYFFILPLLVRNEWLEIFAFINTIFWFVVLIYPIFILTTWITKVLTEMKKTSDAVHSLLSCAVGKEIKLELEHFSLLLLHRNIKFTANGFFTLDNSLFHAMIGATAMYLVILVQFQVATVPLQ